jgi:3-hydroxyacyl-[acyl-carrier-protein] dehydratase
VSAAVFARQDSKLEADDLRDVLPHRPPFLLLDRVTHLEPGVYAAGIRNVSVAEPWFAGHFPDSFVLPGVLVIESLAQLAGVVLAAPDAIGARGSRGYLASVRAFKFVQPVRPGDQLLLEAHAGASVNGITDFTVSARAGEHVVATGRIAIAHAEQGEQGEEET